MQSRIITFKPIEFIIHKKYQKAFTLVELITAIAISGLVVALIYRYYLFIAHTYHNLQNQKINEAGCLAILTTLEKDILTGSFVFVDSATRIGLSGSKVKNLYSLARSQFKKNDRILFKGSMKVDSTSFDFNLIQYDQDSVIVKSFSKLSAILPAFTDSSLKYLYLQKVLFNVWYHVEDSEKLLNYSILYDNPILSRCKLKDLITSS